ncbi:MAG: M48 family metallopeptidase [Archangiaceae bacterium]|nr:M48 family metallopeptidase [Archangiaceae bacterium]
MQITVERDGSLTMTAPPTCQRDQLERFARAKRLWVYEKLALKDELPPSVKREFVSGEGFPYLGRSYRLQLVRGERAPLRLEAGRFKLPRAQARAGEQLFTGWYVEHAQVWLEARVAMWAERLGVSPASVTVRDQGYRWASCAAGGRLYFHWRVIQLPPRLIDYVIVHELVHLTHDDHSPAFWRAMARVLPDCDSRRELLRRLGAQL